MEGWDGRLLHCEEMPDDAPKGPMFWDHEHDGAMLDVAMDEEPHDHDHADASPFSKFGELRRPSCSLSSCSLISVHTLPQLKFSMN